MLVQLGQWFELELHFLTLFVRVKGLGEVWLGRL